MRLHTLAASVLLASAESKLNEIYGRDLAFVIVDANGSICPSVPNVTFTETVTNTVTNTQTVTNGTGVTATTTSGGGAVTGFVPPFNGGQGLPSGFVTDLPLEQFFFLAYATPGAAGLPSGAPQAKRDLERRQQGADPVATALKLVDLTNPAPPSPAVGPDSCDFADPLDLVRGVLNGKANGQPFSVAKVLDASSAILGYFNSPPDNQVNITFAIQGGLLQWNTPDMGAASFYNCTGTIYAGFPNLAIAGCVEVLVSPIAGQVCINYVQQSRTANPDFTAPLTSSSTSSVSSVTATVSVSTTATASGSGSSVTASSTASGSASSDTASSTASGSDNGSSSLTSTITNSGSSSSDASTTSSSPVTSSAPAPVVTDCLVVLPDSCSSGLLGISAGNALDQGTSCLADLLPQLDIAGATRAATCLTTNILNTASGADIVSCLTTNVLCFSGSSTRSAASPSGSQASCLVVLPDTCANLISTPLDQVINQVLDCAGSLNGQLDVSGTTNAVNCLLTNTIPGITQGGTILTCLNQRLLCTSSTTSSMSMMSISSMSSSDVSSTTSAASSSSSLPPLCVPKPASCENPSLPASITTLDIGSVITCVGDAVDALTSRNLLDSAQRAGDCLLTFLQGGLPQASSNLISCLTGPDLLCAV